MKKVEHYKVNNIKHFESIYKMEKTIIQFGDVDITNISPT